MGVMTAAIIVTYHPEPGHVSALIQLILPQVNRVLIIDNGTGVGLQDELRDLPILFLPNPKNIGLAAALNQGLSIAADFGEDAVVLLDQDSEPSGDMVERLQDAYASLSNTRKVAAVGPLLVDARNGKKQPFVRIGFPLNTKIVPDDDAAVACDYLITSGCYIPMTVLADVGMMDDALFIDNIDMDWSFRAKAKGYELFGVPTATMMHRIGDVLFDMPMGMGQVMVHSPKRLYYSSRNRVLLYRRKHVSWTWILQDVPRFALKFMRLVTFVKPRRKIARAMILGLFDGIAGRTGEPSYRFD